MKRDACLLYYTIKLYATKLHDINLQNPAYIILLSMMVFMFIGYSTDEVSAQGELYSPEPVWRSVDWDDFLSSNFKAAFGDANYDGYLDMVINVDSGFAIYYNAHAPTIYTYEGHHQGIFTISDMAFADVNRDGFLDVVVAQGQSRTNHLYLNHGGVWGWDPWWESSTLYDSRTLALGDLDEDGDLDVIFGNGRSNRLLPNTLYLNNDDYFFFASDPHWLSNEENGTADVILGDIDSDGDLDLICANGTISGEYGRSTLYLNRWSAGDTTIFAGNPDHHFGWSLTYELALGDVDGDGDLDLVCDTADSCTLHLNRYNEGPPWDVVIFDSNPAWAYAPITIIEAVSLGDVDGDGDLDLLCGDSRKSNLLFLNVGGLTIFEDTPEWEFETEYSTSDLVLGDVDNDGDLDLLSVNTSVQQGTNLYLNQSPVLDEAPSEPMLPSEATGSVALGDIDGDDQIDLVCGNNGTSRLYLNTPTWPERFQPVSQWNNQFPATTRDVALADINGDGALDLVCGNYLEANTIFLNTGGNFSATPSWLSAPSEPTTSVAVGDIDGNGFMDIVCGNLGAANRLYRNDSGSLATHPSWNSAGARNTRSVALGDIDADGDLDLVCGNDGEANTAYLNDGGVLIIEPGWEAGRAYSTWSVALGDVTGDGFPDLACGNLGQENTLFINVNGSLTLFPAWTSGSVDSTRSVELHDIDGDGDLDLLCGNHGSPNTIYLNTGDLFTEEPVWYSDSVNLTNSLAVGDLDSDGDWDLVYGNEGQVNALHFGRRNPVYLGDPTAPTNHLPHSPIYLEDVTVQQPSANLYQVQLTAFDIESDPLWLLPKYRYKNESTWRQVESGDSLGPFKTSPTGSPVQFDWDVSSLNIDQRDVILGLYAINAPTSVSIIRYTTSFHKDIGPLNVRRPQVAVAPGTLVFPGVTVGDTVEATLSVTNTGNEVLNVASVDLPSTEMWLAEEASFSVPAGETSERTVLLGPRTELSITGNVVISSDAPLTPEVSIPVETDIHPLTCDTQALLEGDTAPLGEALTIQVIPDEDVHLERGALHYCPASENAAMITIEMTPQGRSFIGVIPGIDVTEAGLLYFIELENSGVLATDPADTSGGNFFALAVEAPRQVLSQAQPTSGSDFLAGREIPVFVTLAEGSVFESGTLNYRRGGEIAYQGVPVQEAELLLSAVIPDSVVGLRGVEYWIEILTSTSALTDPPSDPAGSPHIIGVRVANLVEPVTHAGFQYRMVSVPLDFGVDFTGTLESLLADQSAFGPYPPAPYELGQWRCFRGLPPDGDYLELPKGSTDDFRVQPGRGFWLISRDENRIATSPVAGTSTSTAGAYEITLTPGWNMIGHPFVFPVAWSEVLVDGQMPSQAEIEGPVIYNGSSYDTTSILVPFAGYWIRNNTDLSDNPRDLILAVPPRESTTVKLDTGPDVQLPESDTSWQLSLTASCAGVQDGFNRLGVAPSASNGCDRHDRHEPPPVPERALSLYFLTPDRARSSCPFTVDMRPEMQAGHRGHSWHFDVAKNFAAEGAGDLVHLEFTNLTSLPQDLSVKLVDRELLQATDLRGQPVYSFYLGRRGYVAAAADTRFLLLVGNPEYLAEHSDDLPDQPTQTVLYQNRPNPFNPATVIRYDVAQAAEVSLRIYDISGSLIKDLRSGHHPVGRYEVAWRGEDDQGRRVASGIYFFQLTTSTGHRETHKMVLMK